MTELVTEVSDFHKALMAWLGGGGIKLLEEVDFPPYQVDVYVPAAHAVIEADGFGHTEVKDRKRDEVLERVYSLKILHVTPEQFAKRAVLAPVVDQFLGEAADDAAVRWEACKWRTPWL